MTQSRTRRTPSPGTDPAADPGAPARDHLATTSRPPRDRSAGVTPTRHPEPLSVWKHEGEHILIDGHNRYNICEKHGKKFGTVLIELEDRDYVKLWMLQRQLGKRNLTDDVRVVLAGKRLDVELEISKKERAAKAGKGNAKNKSDSGEDTATRRPSSPPSSSRKRAKVAKEEKVSEKRLRALQAIKKKVPELEDMIQSQTVTLNEAKKLASLDAPARKIAIAAVDAGKDVPSRMAP